MEPEIIAIRASAGSGKTYELSLRYLRLLKKLNYPSPVNLRKIIAITFTNKAAWEMKERIILFLKEIALSTQSGQKLSRKTHLTPEQARKWLENIILNYSDFYVRTIDSLLFAILKALCFELKLKPDLNVTFNPQEIFDTAFDKILFDLPIDKKFWEDLLDTFFKIDERGGFYPESGLRNRLFELIAKTPDKVKAIKAPEIFTLERELDVLKRDFLKTIDSLAKYINGNLIKNLNQDISLESLHSRTILTKNIEEVFKKKYKNQLKEIKEFEDNRERLRQKLNEWIYIKAIYRVSGYAQAILKLKQTINSICEQEGIVPGSDWWTRIILKEMRKKGVPPLIYAHFGSKFSHFLFDEFQDTSRDQWDGLNPLVEEALSSGGSLFLVGDIKQAIYRWRGGDWHLFGDIFSKKKYFTYLDPNSFKEKSLDFNYRSNKDLVEFFNKIFDPLSDENKVYDGLSTLILGNQALEDVKKKFSKDVARAFQRHTQRPANTNIKSGVIKIYNAEGSSDEVKGLIKESFLENLKKEWSIRSKSNKIEIAVLVRNHATGEEISSWLIHEGIPVITENSLKLKVSSVVKGILCFLSYLYDPSDKRAIYGIFSSNILNFGPKSESELCSAWIKGDLDRWILELNELIEQFKPLVNKRAPYEIIQFLLKKLNLIDRLNGDLGGHKVFVDRLLEVTHYFEIESGPSLGRYLAFWEQGGLEEQVGFPENINAVRVLTIHKAKGLEFPVVFIPFTNWRINDLSPVVIHDGFLIHLKKPLTEELERKRLTLIAEEAQELLNLFYVAVTRARESLYLYLSLVKGGGLKPLSFWIKSLLQESENLWNIEELN